MPFVSVGCNPASPPLGTSSTSAKRAPARSRCSSAGLSIWLLAGEKICGREGYDLGKRKVSCRGGELSGRKKPVTGRRWSSRVLRALRPIFTRGAQCRSFGSPHSAVQKGRPAQPFLPGVALTPFDCLAVLAGHDLACQLQSPVVFCRLLWRLWVQAGVAKTRIPFLAWGERMGGDKRVCELGRHRDPPACVPTILQEGAVNMLGIRKL